MKSFEDFLASQKDATVDHVVVGNAAGDADSIISALTYGYIESELGGGGTTKTPFVSISKNDLETQRPEVAFLFRALGLGTIVDSLRFIDDPILRDNQNKRKLTLVDHNRAEEIFQSNLSHWDVVEILDHHFDEQQHVDTCPSGESRHVAFDGDKALVASTCTLVAERLKTLHGAPSKKYPSTLSTLLLGTILLDSVNMIPQAGKGTPRDAAAIQDLLEHTDWSTIPSKEAVSAWWPSGTSDHSDPPQYPPATDSPPDTTRMFDSLQAAKFDPAFWNGLSVLDSLRLDYKRFSAHNEATSTTHVFGASAVLLPRTDFLSKPDVLQGIYAYMTEHVSVDFLAILLFHKCPNSGDNRRQLILCEKLNKDDKSVMDPLIAFLGDDGTLMLEEVQDHGNASVCNGKEQLTIRLFDQKNAKASRKQVAPLLMKYFETQ